MRAVDPRACRSGVASLLLLLSACGPATEEEAFDEVISSMSIDEAGRFLERYPGGARADELVRHLREWCLDEPSPELREAVAAALPPSDPRSAELRRHCVPAADRRGG